MRHVTLIPHSGARAQFEVVASIRNPSENHRANFLASKLSCDRAEVAGFVRLYHDSGYWVEVFAVAGRELLAGPFDPDAPAPARILF